MFFGASAGTISCAALGIVSQVFQVFSGFSVRFREFCSGLFGYGQSGTALLGSVGLGRTESGEGRGCDWLRDGHRHPLSCDHLF